MQRRGLTIVHVSAELDPFSRSGGLSVMVSSLARAHAALGHRVIIISPYYKGITDKAAIQINEMAQGQGVKGIHSTVYQNVSFYESRLDDASVYLIGNDELFGARPGAKGLYGSERENERFLFLCVAALDLLKRLDIKPDVINCHDWHAGLIPYLLKGKYKSDPYWKGTATVFTIHNLAFQLGRNWWQIPAAERDGAYQALPHPSDAKAIGLVNFAKRAIITADAINTVSETYREEVLTKDFGEELHRILKNRADRVFGIVNGIDFKEFNPLTDPGLAKRYSDKSPERKRANKRWLQKHYGLKEVDHPLICMTSRITEQKGFILLLEVLEDLLAGKVQVIVMGDGAPEFTTGLKALAKRHPHKLVVTPFNSKYETSLYAGSDLFLLPSRFEPCGINQMIAMRYGCIPVVHRIGGLADTVRNFNPSTGKGNGFSFKRYEATDLFVALVRAIEAYKYKTSWKQLVRRAMLEANSWKIPAQKYIDLYRAALKLKETK
jgi:starch synthase